MIDAHATARSEVRVLTGTPAATWNRYVHGHAQGSVFHLAEWATVYAELPWLEPCFLEAWRDGCLVGLMPLAIVHFGFGRRALVSSPYCVQAGALADDADAQDALETAAVAHARSRRVDFLDVRQTMAMRADWPVSHRYCGFARSLATTVEGNLEAIPRKQRAMVRKGEAAGLLASPGMSLDAFYRLYAISVRNLGTPVYSRRLFAALMHHLAPYLNMLKVEHGGQVVAAVLSFYYQSTVMPYYAGALPIARELKAYDFLYWQLMCSALARGCTRFDFGRSVCDSGAAAFKKNWGFDARPLSYQLLATGRRHAAELDPDSRFNRAARQAWSRLPLCVANRLGPRLARRLY